MDKRIMELLGYINENQWVDALKNDPSVKSILLEVEDHYGGPVVCHDKKRAKYGLDK